MDVKRKADGTLSWLLCTLEEQECKSSPCNGRYYTRQECGEGMYYTVIKGACK